MPKDKPEENLYYPEGKYVILYDIYPPYLSYKTQVHVSSTGHATLTLNDALNPACDCGLHKVDPNRTEGHSSWCQINNS